MAAMSMRSVMLFACAAFSLSAARAPAPERAPDPLQAKVDAIRDRFVAAALGCGLKTVFVPTVVLDTGPAVISYESDRRRLLIGRYEALPPPIQSFLTDWAAHDMPGQGPKALFNTLFNGFLVAHELGHWIDDMNGRVKTLDHYDQEIEANRFAIAFAARAPSDDAKRDALVHAFSYLNTLPNPVPKQQDPRVYFDAHYADIANRNPLAYNWYQGLFMRTAFDKREQADFCSLVRLKPNART